MKMKDGRTRMAYKTEHAIDLDSDIVLSAGVHRADESDTATFTETLIKAQAHTILAGSESKITDVVADKGYHSTDNLVQCEAFGVTFLSERVVGIVGGLIIRLNASARSMGIVGA